ncbi:hypothetical protein F511_12215 [Dorcoceras hygrometricum]|uniref:Uncharacterized protein n=1 Tax=Dorcoceras hygrometricum TaxID=472368 RepID=A0A2Z7BA85_9LAMI|nr:hypothetical protein F511_12215 [Dorcoceras hygrometricum]
MRMRSDKKPSRKHDRKVLMAEESTKSWADSDSESSSSSSSSSDSEQEEVHCVMADQMADDEVFYQFFSSTMASAYYSNTVHINFASVLAMVNPGMVSVFNALMAFGLEGFLGCPAVIYESELVDFFKNGLMRDGLVELGESSEFPISKILTDKTVHRYISINDKVGVEEAADAPPMKKASRKPAASKKRPAVSAADEPVPKKKRTSKKKYGSSPSTLEIVVVAQEAVPIQMVGSSTSVPAAEEPVEQPAVAGDVDTGVVDFPEPAAEDAAEESVGKDVGERVHASFSEPAVANIKNIEAPTADDVDSIIQQVLSETAQSESTEGKQIEELDIRGSAIGSQAAVEEKHWFDLSYEDLIARWDAERPVVTASDTDEEEATMDVGTAGGDQQVQCSEEEPAVMKTNDDLLDADEQMSQEDILLTILVDVPLPSAGMEITKITLGKTIKIPGVDEKTKYLGSLPQIPADDKGKEILVEKNPVNGNPAKEHYFLICADIDLLVHLRAQVIEAVDQFFHSFSFKKLATFNIEELSRKEEQVLIWGETEITHVALSRKRYILLKYREVLVRKFLESWKNNFVVGQGSSAVDLKVIGMLSDLHSFVLEELRGQALAHGLIWNCSKIVEGSPRDRGAIIARTNTNTRSTCGLRTMIRVDGVWVVEPFCYQWVKIPRPVVCTEVSKQCSFVDFFPAVSEPLRILKKIWADICLEVVGFCASRRLLPVGSLHFCRSLSVVEPVFRVSPRQSPVFALRVSQFCSVFIDFSLFSWLPTADIIDFISSIALDRTVFRDVQIAQNTVSVAPSVQMLDEPSSSDSSSDDILMDFSDQDTTAAANSLPAATTLDVTNSLNQLRASIDQIRERDDGGAKNKDTLLLHLSNFENQVIARLDAQDRVLGELRKASNDQRNLLSLELQSSHKQLGAQIVTTGLDVVDVRRVVKETHQELNAKINSLDEKVAATRNDLLEFSAQAQQSLNVITTQLNELVAYINWGGDNKKGESSSSRGPQPPPPPVSTPDFEQRVEMAQRNILERVMDTDRLENSADAFCEKENQQVATVILDQPIIFEENFKRPAGAYRQSLKPSAVLHLSEIQVISSCTNYESIQTSISEEIKGED